MTVECTYYKQGHYEGYQERAVPILDPQGGERYVLRPLYQQAYDNFRDRNAILPTLHPSHGRWIHIH